jgi:hypothetical protein
MDPIQVAWVRRHWQVVGAIAVLVAFSVLHLLWFGPTLARYKRAQRDGSALGMSLDQGEAAPMLPPRLFALISDNSLPAAAATEQSASGALTADLLGDLNRRAGAHGIEVLMSEPGLVTQQGEYVLVGAHLRMRGPYGGFVALLDDLASSRRLLSVEKFSLSPNDAGLAQIDLVVSRCVLKRAGGPG